MTTSEQKEILTLIAKEQHWNALRLYVDYCDIKDYLNLMLNTLANTKFRVYKFYVTTISQVLALIEKEKIEEAIALISSLRHPLNASGNYVIGSSMQIVGEVLSFYLKNKRFRNPGVIFAENENSLLEEVSFPEIEFPKISRIIFSVALLLESGLSEEAGGTIMSLAYRIKPDGSLDNTELPPIINQKLPKILLACLDKKSKILEILHD